MKTKMHQTKREEQDKNTLHIKTDVTKLPNHLHFDVQKKTRAHVFDDRRKRAPKHKKKALEDE